jgi:AcrR family transcriptional regulator
MGNTDAKRFASVFPTVILSSLVGHFFTSRSQRTKGKGHREDMARTPKMTEDRREQIIDAALRVFAQKGFARATNSEIAREAGNMTPGLIYYYFKSKEDLLKVVLQERSPLRVSTQIYPEMLGLPPDALLPLVVERLLTVMEDEQFISMIRVILPEMLHGATELSPIVLSCFQRLTAYLRHTLQIQVDKGTLRADLDPSATAQLIATSLIGIVLSRQILCDPSVQECPHEELVRLLLESLD